MGDARGNALLPAGEPGRREMSEGVRIQALGYVSDAPHQPAGIAKPAVCIEESSTQVLQRGHPLCPTVPHGSASGGKG